MTSMIKHIVMWRVRGDTDQERAAGAQMIKSRFEDLRGRIPGLHHIEVGVDMSRVDYACDVVLYSEFTDMASLHAYGDHPAHTEVRKAIGDLRIARHQVDYIPDLQDRP
jgi:quinol monooxygenase YgiN